MERWEYKDLIVAVSAGANEAQHAYIIQIDGKDATEVKEIGKGPFGGPIYSDHWPNFTTYLNAISAEGWEVVEMVPLGTLKVKSRKKSWKEVI